MYELIATYGMLALGLLLTGGTTLLVRFVLVLIESKLIREYVARAWDETKAAVLLVGQTYTDEIKAGRADGKLTSEEKAIAKRRAIEAAKKNIGMEGLKRLARIFDVDDWLGDKVEAVVAATKTPKLISGVEAAPPKP